MDDSQTGLAHTEFGQEFIQLLSPAGQRIANAEYDPWLDDVTDELLLALLTDMVIVRRIDIEATALQRQGELGIWAPLLGQEAAQVGSVRVLDKDDFVYTSYREHAIAYCRGAELAELSRAWRGVAQSGWDPAVIRVATPSIIISAQALHATGYALGCLFDDSRSVAVAYFGDGAMSEGDLSEAFVFAASFAAPVLFFCQNNQWAISEPVELQSVTPLARRAPGFGIPSLRVDGNDILAVMAATRVALDRARTGGGPSFIEAVTYRMGPHTTADDPTRYRDAAELAEWAERDPILRLRRILSASGTLTDDVEAQIQAQADAVASTFRAACLSTPDPEPLSMFDNVYTTPQSILKGQRDGYADYLDSFTVDAGTDGPDEAHR